MHTHHPTRHPVAALLVAVALAACGGTTDAAPASATADSRAASASEERAHDDPEGEASQDTDATSEDEGYDEGDATDQTDIEQVDCRAVGVNEPC
jgi:hypothetical protein